jgi:hypothetical protein
MSPALPRNFFIGLSNVFWFLSANLAARILPIDIFLTARKLGR